VGGTSVEIGVAVGAAVGTIVAVAIGVGTIVAVAIGVGIAVAVAIGVGIAVAVAIGVGTILPSPSPSVSVRRWVSGLQLPGTTPAAAPSHQSPARSCPRS
jgi:hypothetical protein